MGIKGVLKQMMCSPLFPVPLEIFQADLSFHDFQQGEALHPQPGITVRTGPLSHPDLATGYRVEYGGKSICYLRSEENTSELQSLMRISYAVFCLQKKNK